VHRCTAMHLHPCAGHGLPVFPLLWPSGTHQHGRVPASARVSPCLCTRVCVCVFCSAPVSTWVRAILIYKRDRNSRRRRVTRRHTPKLLRRDWRCQEINGFSSVCTVSLCCSYGVSSLLLLFCALCTPPGWNLHSNDSGDSLRREGTTEQQP
jgi:hypothetical protein